MGLFDRFFDFVMPEQTLENELTEKSSDEVIMTEIRKWYQNDERINRKIYNEGKKNYLYYIGKYERDDFLPVNRSHVKDNRIFTNIKSVIPHITSKPAEPEVHTRGIFADDEKEKEAKRLGEILQELLKRIYLDCGMQKLNEANSLNRYIYKCGVLKTEIRKGKIFEKLVNPQLLLIDGNAKNINDMRYIGERIVDKTAADLIELYPNKKDVIKQYSGEHLGTKIEIVEWWTNELRIVTIKDRDLLEVEKNPLWDYKRSEFNYFNEAPIPYSFLNVYNTGVSLLDDTSEIDLTLDLQDGVNDLLRQIVNNAKYNGSPVKIGTGIAANRLENVINNVDPGAGISLAQGETISYLQAAPLPAYVIQALEIMYREIDNIFGAQQSFRGEYESAQSGTSRQVLRQGSENSLAIHARAIERLMSEKFKHWVHLIYILSDDMDFINNQIKPILGQDLTDEFLELLLNNKNDGMEVYVKEGSMLPDDKMSQMNQAISLAQQGRISTELLYERLGIPHPEREAKKTLDEAAETKARAMEIQTEAEIRVEQMKNKFQKSAEAGKAIEEQINQLGGGQNMETRVKQMDLENMINNLGQ